MSLFDLFTYQLHPIKLKMVMMELSVSKIFFEVKSSYVKFLIWVYTISGVPILAEK